MHDDNETTMNNLSLAESLLNNCEKSENTFKAMNILCTIFSSTKDEQCINIALNKMFECFSRVNKKTKICLIHIVRKFKILFDKNLYIKSSIEDLIKYILVVITTSDPVARRCSLELIKELPYVMNLELLHLIFDLYTKEVFVMDDEREKIIEIFRTIIKSNLNYKKNILLFIQRNSINI